MLFPLKVPILLLLSNDIYLTSIIFVGKDFIKCKIVYKKYILKFDDEVIPKISWIKISDDMLIKKHLIIGYSNLNNSSYLYNEYKNNNVNDVLFENKEISNICNAKAFNNDIQEFRKTLQ
jgi:hypothetical protein